MISNLWVFGKYCIENTIISLHKDIRKQKNIHSPLTNIYYALTNQSYLHSHSNEMQFE